MNREVQAVWNCRIPRGPVRWRSRIQAISSRFRERGEMTAIEFEATVETRTRALQIANAELLHAMERTEEATRQKSAFLANMSHELRTPLSSIIGFAELLQSEDFGPLTDRQAHFVGNILSSGQHLLTLINDLLDLSKIEAGKLALQPESFPLAEALDAAVCNVRPQADQKCQSIEVIVEDGISSIKADPTRFTQILYNLLSNAIKFSHAGGRITVTARIASRTGSRSANRLVEIAVTDTGIGIKAEDLTRLFQRFTQIEAPVVKQYQGAGLGLALTKCLIELHGGSIQAHSDGEGCGSTFTIRLPHYWA